MGYVRFREGRALNPPPKFLKILTTFLAPSSISARLHSEPRVVRSRRERGLDGLTSGEKQGEFLRDRFRPL